MQGRRTSYVIVVSGIAGTSSMVGTSVQNGGGGAACSRRRLLKLCIQARLCRSCCRCVKQGMPAKAVHTPVSCTLSSLSPGLQQQPVMRETGGQPPSASLPSSPEVGGVKGRADWRLYGVAPYVGADVRLQTAHSQHTWNARGNVCQQLAILQGDQLESQGDQASSCAP